MMNMNDVILKKRNGGKLTQEEIKYFVDGYTKGEIPDYQASALLMAIYFQKMDREETFQLTDAMRELARTKGMMGVEFSGTRYDMGNKLGVLQAIVEVGLTHPEIGDDFRAYLKGLSL